MSSSGDRMADRSQNLPRNMPEDEGQYTINPTISLVDSPSATINVTINSGERKPAAAEYLEQLTLIAMGFALGYCACYYLSLSND